MAASDQNYRNQRALDVVFGVSCVLMLLSIVALFAQDYFRPWKRVQRQFRDADEAVTQRLLLAKVDTDQLKEARGLEEALWNARKDLDKARSDDSTDIRKATTTRDQKAHTASGIKADYDSSKSRHD